MKKTVKITGIVLAVILVILVVLPFAFKGKIMETVKREINKNIHAQVDFGHLGLNFFSHFPNASVSLEQFYIAGINAFEGDTLVSAHRLSATINLKSLFGDSGYEISRINLENARLHAILLADGKANWDILPEDDEDKPDDNDSDFQLSLKKVSLDNVNILYDDFSSNMNVALEKLNMVLSGNMTADETRIQTRFTAGALTFIRNKIPYLSQALIQGDMDIDADLKNMKFTLAKNTLQINAIKASVDGWVSLPDDEKMDMDIQLHTPSIQFKDILSLIPAIYSKDFQQLKTSGEVALKASAKGTMQGDDLPAFDVLLKIDNAMFQYPGMPKSVTNIHTDIHASNPGGSADNTLVDISKFHIEMGGNPFDINLQLTTPVSDPNIRLGATGKLNLSMVKEIYPLEDMELSGMLDANLKLASRMSAIEKEQFDKVEAFGTLNIQEMLIKSASKDDIQLHTANLTFSPRYVDLNTFTAQIGKNDLSATGKLENFIPYFLNDKTLKGKLAVHSNYLNLNDFMAEDAAPDTDTTSIGVIEIPRNLDFALTGTFKQIVFDKLNMTNVSGQINIKDGKADMSNLSMNALGGKLNVNGYYDTGKNAQKPDVALSLDIQEASFAQTYSTFLTIQKLAPIFESMAGNFSTNFQLNSTLGSDFMPDFSSLKASGLLQSNNVEVSNVSTLNALASALKNDSFKTLKIKDLKLPFSITDGRVTTKPFAIHFGSGSMNLEGSTGLDQSINYTAKINLAEQLTNNYLKNVTVKIGGTFKSPKIVLDTKDVAEQVLGKVAGSLLGNGKTTASLAEQATEQIDKQIENIRQKAKDAGDKLVAEADKQGKKLIDEANKTTNPLAKIAAVKAAEAGAKKLKEEAQKQAGQLSAAAEREIGALPH
ncbi:MAG: AsmA family protein [Candidatus Symbiothrix sp.]|jgi:hypothetical protein|nr:AsmA family protein [Candidatus Symbiothrix sp.]